MFRCRGGMCLASEEEVEAQRQRGLEVIEHYSIYVDLLSRLKNRRARSYHPFAEGVRRSRGVPFGTDHLDQPEFRAHFGDQAFKVGDAAQRATMESVVRSWAPDVILASPPCQPYSTADKQGATRAKRMIPLMRGYLESLGGLYAIENVKGAAKEMLPHAVLLYGSFFGLGVDRPRFFEANFPVIVDEYLRGPGLALRLRSCLGPRRKWRRLDPFGRPEPLDCCRGNLYPIQGSHPAGFTAAEGALAMGVDVTHMSFERLSQAIPPVYAQLVFALACMEACRTEFGVPAISFDARLRDPRRAERTLGFWLRALVAATRWTSGWSCSRRPPRGTRAERGGRPRPTARAASLSRAPLRRRQTPWSAPRPIRSPTPSCVRWSFVRCSTRATAISFSSGWSPRVTRSWGRCCPTPFACQRLWGRGWPGRPPISR
jgi:hypothetical protein